MTGMLLCFPAIFASNKVKVSASTVKSRMAERPALLAKFNNGEALTPEQMVVVYYGQQYAPSGKPAASYPAVDAAYAKKDYAGTLKLVDDVLKTNPVALNQLFRGYVAASASKDPAVKARMATFQQKIDNICSVIYASGTGLTNDSPFITLSKEDSQAFLRNYLQPEKIVDNASIDALDAYKVVWPGQTDLVIFYFGRL